MEWTPLLADVQSLCDRAAGVHSLASSLGWTFWRPQRLSPSSAVDGEIISLLFDCTSDLNFRRPLTDGAGSQLTLVYLTTLVDDKIVNLSILPALGKGGSLTGEVKPVYTFGEAVAEILSGAVLLLVEGAGGALALDARGWQRRAVQRPFMEATVRGNQEAFVEDLDVNISLVRRRLKDPRLRFERFVLGALTRTEVRLVYLQGLTNDGIVDEARRRLGRVRIDGVLEGAYLEEQMEDDPYSPFPQFTFTERPDQVVAGLLEGRVALLTDGTPDALVAPATLWSFLDAADDAYQRYVFSSLVRMLRYVFTFAALLLPSLYIAAATFHQQMIPTALLITLAASREGIPFPAFTEAFLMELGLEIMREASERLRSRLGVSIGIVGALVIGQAAVSAGIVSAPMVVIVSLTAIANFAIPHWEMALAVRILRFPLMTLAAAFGGPGLLTGLLILLVHLVTLRSFGVPYLSPATPLDLAGLGHVVTRPPYWAPGDRPRPLAPYWRRRSRPGRRPTPAQQGHMG